MNPRRPGVIAKVIATDATDATAPINWEETVRLFAAERWYWVATTSDQCLPHLRPVLAVWVDERIYSTTNPAARKGRDLTGRPSAAFAARAPDIDIVIEGRAAWIDDRQQPRRTLHPIPLRHISVSSAGTAPERSWRVPAPAGSLLRGHARCVIIPD